jgi:hypothetical protein
MMSGKGWHSGGLRVLVTTCPRSLSIAKGAALGAKDAGRVMSGRATKGGDPSALQRLTWGCIHRRFLF